MPNERRNLHPCLSVPHLDRPVDRTGGKPAAGAVESPTGHRIGMPGKRPNELSSRRLPDLDHPIAGTGDERSTVRAEGQSKHVHIMACRGDDPV